MFFIKHVKNLKFYNPELQILSIFKNQTVYKIRVLAIRLTLLVSKARHFCIIDIHDIDIHWESIIVNYNMRNTIVLNVIWFVIMCIGRFYI